MLWIFLINSSSGVNTVHGPTKNPWNMVLPQLPSLNRSKISESEESQGPSKGDIESDDFIIAGGSSGGSAAAVSAGTCLA